MEKRKKGLTKTPNGDGPKRNKMDFREKKKNSPAKTPFEKKKSGKIESKIN